MLALPSALVAQNECGLAPAGGTVICGAAQNPYPDGITYIAPADDLTIVLDEGVVIDTSGGPNLGILVLGLADTDISVLGGTNTSITTDATGAFGVLGATTSGALRLSLDDITTTGDNASGIVASSETGLITVEVSAISTAGDNADGISANTNVGNINATTNNVTVTGANSTAIAAISDAGDLNITSSGSVIASGRNGGGIVATSSAGNTNVVVNDVSTVSALAADTDSGRAAVVATGANTTVRVNGTAQTSGTGFIGSAPATVSATATDGNASIVANNVIARGDGISAVMVTATNNASATLNGEIAASGDGAAAVIVNGGNTATVTLGADGNVTAADGDGIVLISANGSTFNNAGITAANGSGYAIAAFGGPLTINNSGVLSSDILFTAGADRVNNAGTFIVDANTDFGLGADIFSNSGTVRFAAGAAGPVSRTFVGLETFNNAGGLIDLRNDIAGDSLALPGTFAGSANSRLGLDVDLSGSGTADRLIVGGAATGSTDLLIDYSGNGGLNAGVVVVDGAAGTQAGAFTLGGGSRNFGLVETDLVFDAANNDFVLVGAPNAAVYRTGVFLEGARNLWHVSADAWSAHMRGLRDSAWGSSGGGSGGRLWIQMYGAVDQRDRVANVSNFGLNRAFDVGYDQDYFGGQIGLNFGGGAGEDGNFSFGVTGGYVNSEMRFSNVADRTSFDVFNAGVYAAVNSGSVFANVLAKYDWIMADATSAIGQYSADFDGNAYGAKGEIGFRLGSDRFFIEPVASIAYVRTDLDDLTVQSSTIEFLDDDGLRGKLGARIGASFPSTRLNTVVLYAGGNYVHEFMGEDSIAFTNNGRTVRFDNRAIGDYGEGVLGVNIGAPEGVSGFIEANGAKGSAYDSYGARAGLRIRF